MSLYPWSDLAACKGRTDYFFTTDGEKPRDRINRETVAKAICAKCPVVEECLEQAIHAEERGIWGGTTDSERVALVRRRTRKAPAVAPAYQVPAEAPVKREIAWRTLESRPNLLGQEITLRITENGETWHGFQFAVFRTDTIAFLADDEADAWLYFNSLVLA
jgi:WhiB family redox-sensing transcriptional regulator